MNRTRNSHDMLADASVRKSNKPPAIPPRFVEQSMKNDGSQLKFYPLQGLEQVNTSLGGNSFLSSMQQGINEMGIDWPFDYSSMRASKTVSMSDTSSVFTVGPKPPTRKKASASAAVDAANALSKSSLKNYPARPLSTNICSPPRLGLESIHGTLTSPLHMIRDSDQSARKEDSKIKQRPLSSYSTNSELYRLTRDPSNKISSSSPKLSNSNATTSEFNHIALSKSRPTLTVPSKYQSSQISPKSQSSQISPVDSHSSLNTSKPSSFPIRSISPTQSTSQIASPQHPIRTTSLTEHTARTISPTKQSNPVRLSRQITTSQHETESNTKLPRPLRPSSKQSFGIDVKVESKSFPPRIISFFQSTGIPIMQNLELSPEQSIRGLPIGDVPRRALTTKLKSRDPSQLKLAKRSKSVSFDLRSSSYRILPRESSKTWKKIEKQISKLGLDESSAIRAFAAYHIAEIHGEPQVIVDMKVSDMVQIARNDPAYTKTTAVRTSLTSPPKSGELRGLVRSGTTGGLSSAFKSSLSQSNHSTDKVLRWVGIGRKPYTCSIPPRARSLPCNVMLAVIEAVDADPSMDVEEVLERAWANVGTAYPMQASVSG